MNLTHKEHDKQIDKQTVTTKINIKSTTTPVLEEGEFYDDDEEEIDEETFESEDRSILDSDLLLNLQLNTEMDIDTAKASEAEGESKEASTNKQKLLLTKTKSSKETTSYEKGESGMDGYRRIDYSTSPSSTIHIRSTFHFITIFSLFFNFKFF